MANGEQKASGRKPLGPPSVRVISPEDAAQLFGAMMSRPRRAPAPDESGKILDRPRAPHDPAD